MKEIDVEKKNHWDLYLEAKFDEALFLLEQKKEYEHLEIDMLIIEGAKLKSKRDILKAENLCSKALKKSEEKNYDQGKAFSSYELAYINFLKNDNDLMKHHADYSIKYFNSYNSEPSSEKLRSQTFIALYYQLKGDNLKAEKLFRSNLEIAKNLGNINNIVANVINLNNLLRSEGKVEQALIEYKQVLRNILHTNVELQYLGTIYNNIADCEELLGYYYLSEKNYLKALKYCTKSNLRLESIIFHNLANLYSKQGNFDKAEYYFKKEIQLLNNLDEKWLIARSLKFQANNFKRKGDLKNAKELFEESIALLTDLEIYNHHYHETICNYVEILGILGLINEAYIYLKIANDVARKHESKLERLMVLLESSRLALLEKQYHQAIFLLDDIVVNARMHNLFDLENNANILLVEAYLLKYLKQKDNTILNSAKIVLNNLKNRALISKRIPFYIRALYLESILLSSTEDGKFIGQKALEIALQTAKEYGIKNLEKYGNYLDHELKKIPNIRDSVVNFAVINVRKFSGRPVITESFRKEVNDSRMIFIAQAFEGPKVIETDDDIIKQDVLFISKSAAFLSLAIGQGSERHTGLFGPLPAPERKGYLYFAYAFSIRDDNIVNIDERFQDGYNYGMLALLVRNDVSLIFYDRVKIEKTFFEELSTINDIKSINKNFLISLRKKLFDDALEAVV